MFKKFPLLAMNNRAASAKCCPWNCFKITDSYFFFTRVRQETILTPEGALLDPMQKHKLHVKLCILSVLTGLVQMQREEPHSLGKGAYTLRIQNIIQLYFLSKVPL